MAKDEEKTLDERLEEFKKNLASTMKEASILESSLREIARDYFNDFELVNEQIKSITDGYNELATELKDVIIPNIKALGDKVTLKDIRGWKKDIADLRMKIQGIKNLQIQKYNEAVIAVNEEINRLKSMTDLNGELKERISKLVLMNRSEAQVSKFNSVKYLNTLKYQEMKVLLGEIDSIKKDISLDPMDVSVYDKLNNSLVNEEVNINKLNDKVDSLDVEKVTLDNIKDLREILNSRVKTVFDIKNQIVKFFDDKVISLDERKKLMIYVNRLKRKNKAIKDKISELSIKFLGNEELNSRLDDIFNKFDFFDNSIKLFSKMITEEQNDNLRDFLSSCENDLKWIENDIKIVNEKNLINKDQFDNLKKNCNLAKDRLKVCYEIVNGLARVVAARTSSKDDDSRIDDLEKSLNTLSSVINSYGKVIDRGGRKVINEEFDKCEDKVKLVEKELEYLKKHDPEKYNSPEIQKIIERLEKCKTSKEEISLNSLRKDYRKKCPLPVRVVKSAKHFYKKHKKACLIAAGFAAIALIHATVGPVIIPAIMHGNIMIAGKSAFLRPVFKTLNKFLGVAINASNVDGLWYLANGGLINPTCAASSLLKGIAVSGGLGVAPLIAGVCMLTNKIKRSRNKGADALSEDRESKLGKAAKKVATPVIGAAKKVGTGAAKIVTTPVSKAVDYFKKEEIVFDEERINKLMHIYLNDKVDFGKTEDYSPEEKKEALNRLRNSVSRKDVRDFRKAGRR